MLNLIKYIRKFQKHEKVKTPIQKEQTERNSILLFLLVFVAIASFSQKNSTTLCAGEMLPLYSGPDSSEASGYIFLDFNTRGDTLNIETTINDLTWLNVDIRSFEINCLNVGPISEGRYQIPLSSIPLNQSGNPTPRNRRYTINFTTTHDAEYTLYVKNDKVLDY